MGLDIRAYKNLKDGIELRLSEDDEEFEDSDFIQLYDNPDFPDSAEGINCKLAYENYDDYFRFRAGSYSGYNHWRHQLAQLAGYLSANDAWDKTSGPFWELINFSDCEGTIGPVISAKLAKDFADFQKKADAHPDEFFKQSYTNWRNACEMAKDNGAVCLC